MPLFSVGIPVHGVEDYLDRCLDSVLGEPATSLEVIAVDDASPDGSGAILAARHDPRLRVISTPAAVGPGPARDLGAKEAAGEYVWFVDGDDELAQGALAAVAGALTRLEPDVLWARRLTRSTRVSWPFSGRAIGSPSVHTGFTGPLMH